MPIMWRIAALWESPGCTIRATTRVVQESSFQPDVYE